MGLMTNRFKQAWRKDHPQYSEYVSRMSSLSAGPNKDSEMYPHREWLPSGDRSSVRRGLSLGYNQQLPYTFTKMAEDRGADEVAAAARFLQQLARPGIWPEARVCAGRLKAPWFFSKGLPGYATNSEMFLHCEDGPAVKFRDSTENLGTERRSQQRGSNPASRKHSPRPGVGLRGTRETSAEQRGKHGHDGAERPVARPIRAILKAIGKRTGVFEKDLPAAIQDRLSALRVYNHGSLPLLDRYLAGEHDSVWSDLIALRAAVRQDPHAADALAVAYETMGRVEANVRIVSDRLVQFGFTKSDGPLHTPPNRRVDTQIRQLEKAAARCRYRFGHSTRVVGSVDSIRGPSASRRRKRSAVHRSLGRITDRNGARIRK